MTLTITELRQAHPSYFSRVNIKLFGDKEYRILHSKDGNPYLVRLTQQWSDMFGHPPVECYRVNPIGSNLKIEEVIKEQFETLQDVKDWLKYEKEVSDGRIKDTQVTDQQDSNARSCTNRQGDH